MLTLSNLLNEWSKLLSKALITLAPGTLSTSQKQKLQVSKHKLTTCLVG